MARKKRIPETARKVTVLLTPAQELALQVIEARRRSRREERDSVSEIVADALWKLLVDVEQVPQEQIEALLPVGEPGLRQSNLRDFPK